MDWNGLLAKFLEHGLWPTGTFTILIMLAVRGDLGLFLRSIQSLRMGDFGLTIKSDAKTFNVLDEYKTLSSLTQSQLHLYLVIGGEGGETTIYRTRKDKMSRDEFNKGFEKLSELGLINFEIGDVETYFTNTPKGMKLHKIIMDNLYKGLNA